MRELLRYTSFNLSTNLKQFFRLQRWGGDHPPNFIAKEQEPSFYMVVAMRQGLQRGGEGEDNTNTRDSKTKEEH
jgi:hypothetical protein